MSSYDDLRRQCRTLESLVDAKLSSHSRLAAKIGLNYDLEADGSNERWKDLEEEIDGLLEKLGETNDQLSKLVDDPNSTLSSTMARAIQRHREVLADYKRDSSRTKANVKAAMDRATLLSGVRNDIDTYKSSASEALLAERGHVDNSHRMTDDLLEQAYETRAEFGRQRSVIGNLNSRMAGVLNTMPSINNLLSMISSRRRRDAIILGCIIGLCFIFLLRYTLPGP